MSLDVWLTDKPQTRYTTGGIVRCLWRQGRVLLTRSPYLSTQLTILCSVQERVWRTLHKNSSLMLDVP